MSDQRLARLRELLQDAANPTDKPLILEVVNNQHVPLWQLEPLVTRCFLIQQIESKALEHGLFDHVQGYVLGTGQVSLVALDSDRLALLLAWLVYLVDRGSVVAFPGPGPVGRNL